MGSKRVLLNRIRVWSTAGSLLPGMIKRRGRAMDDDLLRDDLAQFMSGGYDNLDDTEAWSASSVEDANRLLRRIRRAEGEIAAHKALVQAEQERLKAWLDDRCAGPLRVIAGAERALEGWARATYAETGTVTHKLPQGTLKLLAPMVSVVVTDETAAVAALEASGQVDLVKQVKSVRVAELKKMAEMHMVVGEVDENGKIRMQVVLDGEILEGIHAEAPAERPFKQGPPSE
jgi:Bacteriophage Mu Gam like protein